MQTRIGFIESTKNYLSSTRVIKKLGLWAENKKFEKSLQGAGFWSGIPLGIAVALHNSINSLPIVGAAASKLPSWVIPAFTIAGGFSGVVANFTGNFGAAIDAIINSLQGKKLSNKERGQIIGLLQGIVLFGFICESMSAANSSAPFVSTPLDLLSDGVFKFMAFFLLPGFMANVQGHNGKSLDDTLALINDCRTSPNSNPVGLAAETTGQLEQVLEMKSSSQHDSSKETSPVRTLGV